VSGNASRTNDLNKQHPHACRRKSKRASVNSVFTVGSR
jgi:hypothetical protein